MTVNGIIFYNFETYVFITMIEKYNRFLYVHLISCDFAELTNWF